LPSCRRDIHNAIVPIDLTSVDDVTSVVDTILSLVQRGIPLRWGLVPQILTEGALEQAKVIYYLQDAYGLSGVTSYLQNVSQAYMVVGISANHDL
jgi:UDP-glucose:glycoprotein glucosyltransferase